MTKKKAGKAAEARPVTADGLPENFRVEEYGTEGKWAYFDHAGRMFKGYGSEDEAIEAANNHVHIEGDPTLETVEE